MGARGLGGGGYKVLMFEITDTDFSAIIPQTKPLTNTKLLMFEITETDFSSVIPQTKPLTKLLMFEITDTDFSAIIPFPQTKPLTLNSRPFVEFYLAQPLLLPFTGQRMCCCFRRCI